MFESRPLVGALAVGIQAQWSGEYKVSDKSGALNYPQSPCIMLEGECGEAKTSMVKAVTDTFSSMLWNCAAPQQEPEDLLGMGMRSEYIMTLPDGTTQVVEVQRKIPSLEAVRLYEAHLNGVRTTLLVDELGDAPKRVQSAYHKSLLDNSFGYFRDGKELVIPNLATVGCFNDPRISTSGSATTHAVSNRSCTLEGWEMPFMEWVNGLTDGFQTPKLPVIADDWQHTIRKVAFEVKLYLADESHKEDRKKCLEKIVEMGRDRWRPVATKRSWTHATILAAAAQSLHSAQGSGGEYWASQASAIESLLIAGCVGKTVADNFLDWRNDLSLGDPAEYLSDEWLKGGQFVENRGDIVAATLSMVSAYYLQNKSVDNYKRLAKFLSRAFDMGTFQGIVVSEVINGRFYNARALPRGLDVKEGRKIRAESWSKFHKVIQENAIAQQHIKNLNKG